MMKNPALTILFSVFSLLGAMTIHSVSAEAQSSSVFNQENLKRIVNGKPQDLFLILENKAVVIRSQEWGPEKESKVQSKFGLKKTGQIPGRSDLVVFEFLKPPVSTTEAISRWNEILNSSDFASLVFAFPEGRYVLSGAIKIQWKKFLSMDQIKQTIALLGLEVIQLQEDSNTALVRGTDKSGKNPLFWSIIFDPLNDPRVFLVSPEFVRIIPPLRSEVSAQAGCLEGAGAGSPVASTICYRIKFYRAPNIEVSFDDLSINTKLLKAWLPENLPQDLRVFKGERTVKKAVLTLASGEVLDIVEYKIQFIRSGEFILPGLKYYYNITGNVEDNKKRLEGLTDEIYVMAAPLALSSQETPNEIPRVTLSGIKTALSGSFVSRLPLWSGILFLVVGILMIVCAVNISRRGRKNSESVPSPQKALDLWKAKKSSILASSPVSRVNMLKELLGVYYFDNPYKFASLHSGDWVEKIEGTVGIELAKKSAEFIRSVEEGINSDTDFEELILAIFGWKEEKK